MFKKYREYCKAYPFDALVNELRQLCDAFVATEQPRLPAFAPQEFSRMERHSICRLHQA